MPTDFNDFEKLCEQLFVSEQISQNKESNEDKEQQSLLVLLITKNNRMMNYANRNWK
jgi:hypothetical protein